MNDKSKKIKIVVVGPHRVGKTSLVLRYVEDRFIEDIFLPIRYDEQVADVTDGQVIYKAIIRDARTGSEDYNRLRPLSYIEADVIVLCFAVDHRLSYENIISEWLPELNHFAPKIPRILVGTKSDLEATITPEEGQTLMEIVKACYYAECSPKEGTGVKKVFDYAAAAYTTHKLRKKNKPKCTIV